jgi:hypothetical protein
MLEDLRHTAGYLISRRRFGRAPQKVISFSHAMSGARSAMLILPLDNTELTPISSVVMMVKRMFNDESVTVVATDHAIEVMRLLPRGRIAHFRREEINRFYLPRPGFDRSIAAHPPDVAIDLNLDFLLPSAYICRASGARIRVGFVRKNSELFYNFQVRPDLTLSRKMIYDRLASCLQRF